MSNYFTKAEKANVKALLFGMRVIREVWDVSKAESTLFGEKNTCDNWSFNKPFFPKFLELKTQEAFMQDLGKVYAEATETCDRGMQELPAQYMLTCNSLLPKYQQFVDNFDTVSNDMKELCSMCNTVAACVDYMKLA